MRFSQKQKKDLETINYFIPKGYTGETVYPCGAVEDMDGDSPEQVFLDYSDRGIQFNGRKVTDLKKLERLKEGKRRRGIMLAEYERGVLDGVVPYFELLEGMPDSVVEFMAKTMFKGIDKELIMAVHNGTISDLITLKT